MVDVETEPPEAVRHPLLRIGLGVAARDARDPQQRAQVAHELTAAGEVPDGVEHRPLGVGQLLPGGPDGLGHGSRLGMISGSWEDPFHHVVLLQVATSRSDHRKGGRGLRRSGAGGRP